MIDLTMENPPMGTWRVETADGTFDYIPDRYRSARVRFYEKSSHWARLLKFVQGRQFRLVDSRGLEQIVRPTVPVQVVSV